MSCRTATEPERHRSDQGLCLGLAVAALLGALALPPGPAAATTPTPAPTPQRTGDLGTKRVEGRVYDASRGRVAGLPSAIIEYGRYTSLPPSDLGMVGTDANGDFAFPLFLHDTDDVRITASAEGYATEVLSFGGYELWTAPPLSIGLSPLSGTVAVSPHTAVSLPCEGDGEVTIANAEPIDGEALTITEILASNSYSQGDYGTGFTWDLAGISLPRTLEPGEQVAFPVHYSAAGQQYPSRLTVRLRSTARNVEGNFAVPYRGQIAGCAAPTPTPTPTLRPVCAGDCDGDGLVTIAELVRAVSVALGEAAAPPCAGADLDADGRIVVNELVAAVNAAIAGCPP
ncbi:MAG: hypothetical protein U0802_04585 [Candidatus Binatia bacterium]